MNKPINVALAILFQNGQFLLQLRDDLPDIAYPGQWGLFGGHLEPGETPEQGLKRELIEEIGYTVEAPYLFCLNVDKQITRYIFCAPLTVEVEALVLGEGQDLKLISSEDIYRGYSLSNKLTEQRSLGAIHQKILLNYLEKCKLPCSLKQEC